MSEPISALLAALLITGLSTPVVIRVAARARLLDVPNARSSHVSVVPRGGGIAVVAGATIAAGAAAGDDADVLVVLVGALVLGAVGLVDDRRGLPAGPRLAAQMIVPFVGALVAAERSGGALVLGVLVSVVWCAGYVNAFNFMDGIDGISATQAALTAAFLAITARHVDAGAIELASWALTGAAIGFLPFNAVRARIFLGDVGSYSIGFWLAATALVVWDAGVSPIVVLGPFLLYIADTSTVLVRRWRRGDSVFEAHREHAYQRLHQAGWSHPAVTLLCAAITLITSAIMLSVIDAALARQAGAFVVSLLVVVAYLCFVHLTSRRRATVSI